MAASLVAGVAIVVAAFYYSSEINDGGFVVKPDEHQVELTVLAVNEGIITIAVKKNDRDVRLEGTFGLEWHGGYGRVGKILDLHDDRVVREFTPVTGSPRGGIKARLDGFAFEGDPSVRGLPFTDVSIDTPLGPAPAWHIPGSSDTWAILVHGKAAPRREAIRILPTIRDAGVHSLVIAYRNDEDAPASPDRRYGYGHDEWQDVAAAMAYARALGARRFVLYGYCMGGAVVMAAMQQPELAGQVTGLILDAPMLDLKKIVDYQAELRHLPRPLTLISEEMAARRYDINWRSFDYLRDAGQLRSPVLLFHGDADRTIPVSTSDELALRRPDIVTYHRVQGARHAGSWNADPLAYETAVRDFLIGLVRTTAR